ncbi:LPXTG-site transpeptidase (sortase) family protein [Mumia flava]|uniref:LPXTG-site transpeptidase (Sortase) family protein n=1 Tax=Mumia flava TaxID=1348852 RepID=A0A2M9BHE5_9ACTN|nr:class F sortase [Mumia flava]PJJ57375.1 LPXTG-site transpeptidase (sortase) family protein [Mumia flava]
MAVVLTAALLGGLLTAAALERSGDGEPDRTFAAELPRATALGEDVLEPAQQPAPRPAPSAKPRGSAALPKPAKEPPAPSRLRIPAANLSMPVRAMGVDKRGEMALPRRTTAVSWYRYGPGPFEAGATVLAGHVDTEEDGIGPLARVAGLRKGDRIVVDSGRRRVVYRITSVTRVAQRDLDTAALFSRTGPPRLHVVTCGGRYRPERGYEDNVVVAARPVERG